MADITRIYKLVNIFNHNNRKKNWSMNMRIDAYGNLEIDVFHSYEVKNEYPSFLNGWQTDFADFFSVDLVQPEVDKLEAALEEINKQVTIYSRYPVGISKPFDTCPF